VVGVAAGAWWALTAARRDEVMLRRLMVLVDESRAYGRAEGIREGSEVADAVRPELRVVR
jgi:hypothetical protein